MALLGALRLDFLDNDDKEVEGGTHSSSLIVDTLGLDMVDTPSDPEGGGVECLAGELGSEVVETADNASLNKGAGIDKLGRLRASLDLTFCLKNITRVWDMPLTSW